MKSYWVYILCSKKNGTLYICVTNDPVRRIYEHKIGFQKGFSKRYTVINLVHIEEFYDVKDAIHREKCIKKWNRAWKLRLIEQNNPAWEDLYTLTFGDIETGFPPPRE